MTAIPDEGYEFVGWSDGYTEAHRRDAGPDDFEVTAIFKRKEFKINYSPNPGGRIEGDTEQTIYYREDTTEVTAIPNEGYEFLSWSDGVMTQTRRDVRVETNQNIRATFAPIGQLTFKVLLVFTSEIYAELTTYSGYVHNVAYKMTPLERQIMEIVALKFAAELNDMLRGEVKFVVDTYFTTIPLGKENVWPGMTSLTFIDYTVEARVIPEISRMLDDYRSVLVTSNFNDYLNGVDSLFVAAGSAGHKYGSIHMEGLFSRYQTERPMEELLDMSLLQTQLSYNDYVGTYLHEFTHTVDPLQGTFHKAQSYHYDIVKYNYEQRDVIGPYLRKEYEMNGDKVGIPFYVWESDNY